MSEPPPAFVTGGTGFVGGHVVLVVVEDPRAGGPASGDVHVRDARQRTGVLAAFGLK